VGNCRSCHTRHGGSAYSGGFAMHSPFGTIYSTNITPDPETGIGRWSLDAFRRAMREGVRADGEHLYPAFPYDRFRHTTDADIEALYAYLLSMRPVRSEARKNELIFPFNVRAGIAVWKRMHMKGEPRFASDRGEYLVEGTRPLRFVSLAAHEALRRRPRACLRRRRRGGLARLRDQ
jgi:mono/diheme cytochrome c family protein